MQAHFDHVAALGEIKEITGAQMWATAGDARVLEGAVGLLARSRSHCEEANGEEEEEKVPIFLRQFKLLNSVYPNFYHP